MYNNYDTYGSYGSNYGSTGLEGFGAFLGGLIILVVIIGIAAAVLMVLNFIGQWKAFKKAGYKGWECLIAGHNQFVNCSFVGINPIWVLFLVFGSVLNIIPFIGGLAYLALFIYYQVVVGISTARAFGKGTGFGIGLAIPVSAPIFWFILGGKNVQYVGANPCNDPIMGMFNKGNNAPAPAAQAVVQPTAAPAVSTQPAVQFCTGCGYKVTNGERFCPGCGKEM